MTLETNAVAIDLFMCLTNNFGVLVHDKASGLTVAIDAPEAAPIEAALTRRGWSLDHIIVTHKHNDHVGGIAELKARHGCKVTGPAEAEPTGQLDTVIGDNATVTIGSLHFHAMEMPGHTLGHLVYHCPQAGALFAGDTLFSLGCGRLFEGTAETLHPALSRLSALPDETLLFCGHDYTVANAQFALMFDPDNAALVERAAEAEALIAAGKPTLPSTMGRERATNPYLRLGDPAIRASLSMSEASDIDVLAELRARKNRL